MSSHHQLVTAGWVALHSADWQSAQTAFEAALQMQESPDAHDGLGIALWWLNEVSAAHQERSTAYVGFKQRRDLRRAGKIAAWLAREQVFLRNNFSAMQGWFARAERLFAGIEPCAELGWYLLLRASMTAPPQQLEQVAQQTLTTAQTFADPDLEALALAFGGIACVASGRVDDGMASLDEAMTAAMSGEVSDFMVISEVFCLLLSACELAGDLVRGEHWCQTAADFAERYQCPFLSAYCRTTYGSLLTAAGRWQDAELALIEAIHLFDEGHQGLRVHAVIKLAELRVLQGKLEEAEVLLTGYEDHDSALVPLARLHLARGEPQLAQAILTQGINPNEPIVLNHMPVLLLLIEVLSAQEEYEAAQVHVEVLTRLAEQTQSDRLVAQAALAKGQVSRHFSIEDAQAAFQAALDRLRAHEQSLLAARARLEMAYTLQAVDRVGAVAWARAALATFERLGAVYEVNVAAGLLRELGAAPRMTGPALDVLTARETEVFELLALGLTNREIAGRLVISLKTVEHHVSRVLDKLGLRNRSEAAAFATRGGDRVDRAVEQNQGSK